MRYSEINELAGVKRFQNMTSEQINTYIKTVLGNGEITILGTGSNGQAIKIGKNVYKLWMIDDAYTSYVEYCLSNSGNPWLPKFLSDIKRMPAFFIRHPKAPDFVNYIKMEELFPIDIMTDYEFKLNVDDELTDGGNIPLRTVYMSTVIGYCKRFAHDDSNPYNTVLKWLLLHKRHTYVESDLSIELKQFIKTLYGIYKLGKTFDLHSGNIMQRVNGQIVILDPISDGESMSLNMEFEEFNMRRIRFTGKPAQSSATYKASKNISEQPLNELFLSPVEWELESDRRNMKKYTFTIGEFSYWVGIICRPNTNNWGVVFDIESEKDNDFRATGTGNAALVLSTVVNICKSFISDHQPNSFRFEARASETSRVSLYRRMSNTLSKTIDYTVSQEPNGSDVMFVLTRNNMKKSNHEI